MTRGRLVLAALGLLVLALVFVEGLRDGVLVAQARYAALSWAVIVGLIALGVRATRRLPRPTRRRSSPPGTQWFPTGIWWGHGRKGDE